MKCRLNRHAVQPCLPNHYQPRDARSCAKGLVEIGIDPRPYRLNCEAHRFSCHRSKAFEAQNIVSAYDFGGLIRKLFGVRNFAKVNDKAFKGIMVMVMFWSSSWW